MKKKISDLEVYAEGTDTEKTELEQIIYKIYSFYMSIVTFWLQYSFFVLFLINN